MLSSFKKSKLADIIIKKGGLAIVTEKLKEVAILNDLLVNYWN